MSFAQKIVAFNAMYRMPVGTKPTVLGSQRLRDLKKILSDELDEIDELITMAEAMEQDPTGGTGGMELLVGMADLMGDIQTEITARTTADTALGTRIDTVQTKTDQNGAAITTEITARTTADTALGQRIDTTNTKVGQNTAAVQDESTARVAGDAALATRITQTETTLNGNIAQAQTQLQTKINTVDGKVTSIGALYTAKVTVNGLIGGFGVYNDGTSVEAGFDVDTFWVGRTNANKRKPFIISGGEVFIDQAVINQLTFDKLRSADGSVIVANGKLKVEYMEADKIVAKNINVTAGGAPGQPFTSMTNGLIQIYDGAGTLRVRMGIW